MGILVIFEEANLDTTSQGFGYPLEKMKFYEDNELEEFVEDLFKKYEKSEIRLFQCKELTALMNKEG